MSRCTAILCALAVAFGASSAAAHPHIFVKTGLRLIHNDVGALTAIEVTWTYDELFSLLLLEDRGLDHDFDGVLTEEEHAKLQGFDLAWPDDFEGDVYLTAGGTPVGLGRPQQGAAELTEAGMLIGRHIRPLDQPVDMRASPVSIKVYDPTYYTAYEIPVDQVSTDAPGCSIDVFAPDFDAAYAQLEAALNELMGQSDFNQEVDFPTVGAKFAEEARVTCNGGS